MTFDDFSDRNRIYITQIIPNIIYGLTEYLEHQENIKVYR